MTYLSFADRLRSTGLVADPWVDGVPRFRERPHILSRTTLGDLYRAAEAVTAAYDEVARACIRNPRLPESYFHLSPWQCGMWAASLGAWHGVARADVFMTHEGPKICEINSDTPTGQVETSVTASLSPPTTGFSDPNQALLSAIGDLLVSSTIAGRNVEVVGIIYPTDVSEDLGLIALYRRLIEARGRHVVLGGPRNVTSAPGDRVALFGTACDLMVRHYKTDLWSERSSAWLGVEPPPDHLAIEEPLLALFRSNFRRKCSILNPFGAVITQNKRSMALMWEERSRFSKSARAAIEQYVPYTARLEAVVDELRDKDQWVLKSDYGCEGDEVIIGRDQSQEDWDEAVALARPGRWIAQRWFEASRDTEGLTANHGVYVIAGRARGLYVRLHAGATDRTALSVPAWVNDVD